MKSKRMILGMGAGQCGLNLLAEILAKQPSCRVTHEETPWLPWIRRADRPGLRERFRRWRSIPADFVGDVASFYLPYVEEAVEAEPGVRMICLKRPKDEIIAGFCRHLDTTRPYPTNHWAEDPGPEWSQEPLLTPSFPQYETRDRVEGLSRYWDEYYGRAEQLERRWPENFRVVDTDVLTTPEGVRSVLDFVGIPREGQVVVTGQRPRWHSGPTASPSWPTAPRRDPMDPRRCAVLVPFQGFIHHDCEGSLKELERRGYHVRRVGGFAAIDQGRNQIATDVLIEGFQETLWIDADIGFHPDDVDRLRSHGLPITCAIYPQKGKLALASHMMPGTPRVTFGQQGTLVEILYAGAGFLLIRREVYLGVQRRLGLPVCNERFQHPMIPFFHPMVRPIEDGHWYLAEDYAFCERARQCGYKIVADTTIRLWHIGTYRYSWEDAGMERPRFASFTLNFRDVALEGSPAGRSLETTLADFAAAHPWPDARPEPTQAAELAPPDPEGRRLLEETVPRGARLLVEVGSGPGRTTRGLADLAPEARVIAVDPWHEAPRPAADGPDPEPSVAPLEAFLAESWDYRDRIIPLRAAPADGLRRIADAGLRPELVSVNPGPGTEDLAEAVALALDLFPNVVVVGSGGAPSEGREPWERLARQRGRKLEPFSTCWRIAR